MRVRLLPLLLLATLVGCGPKPAENTPTSTTAPPGDPDAKARALAKERLETVKFAMQKHESTFGQFPGAEGKHFTGLSWRVRLLRYGGGSEQELYSKFKTDEPWDSENNKALVEKMPAMYASPGKPAPAGQTYLRSFVGKSAFLDLPEKSGAGRGRNMQSLVDGASTVLAVAEAAESVIWTKPDDLEFDGKDVPRLGGAFADGFHGLMADGQILFFPKEFATDDLLRKLISINDAQPIDLGPIRKANGLK